MAELRPRSTAVGLCDNCAHARPTTRPGVHACHRYPPQALVVDGDPVFVWPWVPEGSSCGEWAPT